MSPRRWLGVVLAGALMMAGALVPTATSSAQARGTTTISGSVVSSGGVGIAGYEVFAVLVGQRSFIATTDATGAFVMGSDEELPAGSYRVEFVQDGYKRPGSTYGDRGEFVTEVQVVPGAHVVMAPVTMVKQPVLRGRVLAQGLPAKKAEVLVMTTDDPDAEYAAATGTGADGRFELALPPGRYRVSFGLKDHFGDFVGGVDYASATVLDLLEGETRDVGDTTLLGAGKLALSLVDRAGEGVGPIVVKVHSRSADGVFTVVASRATFSGDGFARLGPLRPGPVWLSFEDPSGARKTFFHRGASLATSTPLTIVEFQQTELRDYLAPTPRVVVDKRPRVLGSARVGRTLRLSSGTYTPRSTTRTVRWLAGNKVVRGARGTSYVVKARDRGKRISVRLTVRAKGHRATTVTTRPTTKVRG